MQRNDTARSSDGLENGSRGSYEIKIKGRLDDRWLDWFEGMTIRHVEEDRDGEDLTVIHAMIADQPALHGFLAKIRDLNLTLISIRRLPGNDPEKEEGHPDDQPPE